MRCSRQAVAGRYDFRVAVRPIWVIDPREELFLLGPVLHHPDYIVSAGSDTSVLLWVASST